MKKHEFAQFCSRNYSDELSVCSAFGMEKLFVAILIYTLVQKHLSTPLRTAFLKCSITKHLKEAFGRVAIPVAEAFDHVIFTQSRTFE